MLPEKVRTASAPRVPFPTHPQFDIYSRSRKPHSALPVPPASHMRDCRPLPRLPRLTKTPKVEVGAL
ncbi:hypothetical protein E2C01_008119 [Portunus trituberculatus]|uniref:Uncharacterized protein n=1 Tax=Portunus trituberculatus TaxID=210409 RepID=A0A5B7CZY4_PORTR|nr:hypothetical protein [Portunus trituberculatus]